MSGDRAGVVVTGASSGIGRACALRLARRGFDVFAGVRSAADADALAAEGLACLTPVTIDVTDAATIAAAARDVSERGGGRLAGLVNNAGIAVAGPLEFIPIDDVRSQLEVNVTGQLAVTQAFMPLLRAARGRIVFMSSIGGRIALPMVGPYAASKHALEGLADSLRRELRPWGIEVVLLEPGTVATPIWAKGADNATRMIEGLPPGARELYGDVVDAMRTDVAARGDAGVAPDVVARRVERALVARRPRTRYLVGDARVRARIAQAVPDRVFDALVARQLGAMVRRAR